MGAAPRLPNVAAAAFADRRGEDLLLALDLAGIAASSGAACAAGALDPSVVLLAMGRSLAEAEGSLRLSAGYETTVAEVEGAVAILRETLRSRAGFWRVRGSSSTVTTMTRPPTAPTVPEKWYSRFWSPGPPWITVTMPPTMRPHPTMNSRAMAYFTAGA